MKGNFLALAATALMSTSCDTPINNNNSASAKAICGTNFEAISEGCDDEVIREISLEMGTMFCEIATALEQAMWKIVEPDIVTSEENLTEMTDIVVIAGAAEEATTENDVVQCGIGEKGNGECVERTMKPEFGVPAVKKNIIIGAEDPNGNTSLKISTDATALSLHGGKKTYFAVDLKKVAASKTPIITPALQGKCIPAAEEIIAIGRTTIESLVATYPKSDGRPDSAKP